MTYPPYRVVIVTLDQHAAGPAARVADSLAQDFPGLTVSVHAAAEWGENPQALAATKEAGKSFTIYFVSLLSTSYQILTQYSLLKRCLDRRFQSSLR